MNANLINTILLCLGYVSWGFWGTWSACSKTCGGGTQNRKRKCQVYSQRYGDCAGENEETRLCNTLSCSAGRQLNLSPQYR